VKQDRMFHVLVLGGIALVGGGGACGSSGLVFPAKDAATDSAAADGGSDAESDADAYFPSELPAHVDAGGVLGDDGGDALPLDAGSDQDAGFPVEAP
jgi:hypothetical protein